MLDGITTVDELCNSRQRFIQVKEFKDKPILLVGTEKGRSDVIDKPMSSGALTAYLKLRGEVVGYLETIPFYSIRRNTAQELQSKIGPEMTRAILAHDPTPVVLEKYYTQERTALVNLTC